MDDRILKRLPKDYQGTVEEIESTSNREIQVVVGSEAVPQITPGVDFEIAVLQITPNSAKIFLEKEDVPLHSIVHEIIHIRRLWLENVPTVSWLENTPIGFRNIAEKLENDLEHLFVIKEEIKRFPEAETYWRKEYDDPSNRVSGTYMQDRTNLLKSFLSAKHALCDDEIASTFFPELEELDLLDEAIAFADDIAACQDKGEVVATSVNYFLPRRFMCNLSYHDPIVGQYRTAPLPNGRQPSVTFKPEVYDFLNL
jgi:hypothetical protein